MKKLALFYLLLFCFLASCSRGTSVSSTESEEEGFAMILDGEYLFSCSLPESWEYCVYPEYSKSFYEYKGEADTSLKMFFYYSATNPDAAISITQESPQSKEPFDGIGGETQDYTFADGNIGMRRILDEDYQYREYIYDPESKYYVCLITSKEDYQKQEEELRDFLDSISFEQGKISKKASDTASKRYKLHIWNEFLQAELTVRPGITFDAVWEWEDTELTFQYLVLYPNDGSQSFVLEPSSFLETAKEDSRTWERCKLESGLKAYYTVFEENGQKGIEYQMIRSGCKLKVYGEETEQSKEIMQSIYIR